MSQASYNSASSFSSSKVIFKTALHQVKAQLKLKPENSIKMQNPYDLVVKSFISYFHWPCNDSLSALGTHGPAPHCVVLLLWHPHPKLLKS